MKAIRIGLGLVLVCLFGSASARAQITAIRAGQLVDPATGTVARDQVIVVENGKVTKSLRNFRFNESPLFMLNNIEALGRAERLAGTEQGGDVVMPSMRVKDFNFTSLSEAV